MRADLTHNFTPDGVLTGSSVRYVSVPSPRPAEPKPFSLDELCLHAQARLRVSIEANVSYEQKRIAEAFLFSRVKLHLINALARIGTTPLIHGPSLVWMPADQSQRRSRVSRQNGGMNG